ncbi:MAG: hypothetical protein KF760_21210 [Candidatus Eremiobacteraeota bacterium]|nr:hypothetical protein [Candidatus Eremiobacteraeota bacterium]MCW5867284.1 hypothetical protein [Candidatus Eremiobacteraeota bacterium]
MEIILTVTIVGMSLTLLVGLMPGASLSSKLARQRVLAGNLAQDVLEGIYRDDLGSLAGGPLDRVTVEGTDFERRIDLTPQTPPSLAVRVRVVVAWKHGKQQRSVFREQFLCELHR